MPQMVKSTAKGSTARAKSAASKRKLAVEVVLEDGSWKCLGQHDPARVVRAIATRIAADVELPALRCGATLVLASDARVRELNRQWRGQDKATNVLSFPAAPPPKTRGAAGSVGKAAELFIGDVILAEETVRREARELDIPAGDHFHHLALHGLLHLLGYDHETDTEAEAMEALETTILAKLGIADPYLEDCIPSGSTPVRRAPNSPTTRRGVTTAARLSGARRR